MRNSNNQKAKRGEKRRKWRNKKQEKKNCGKRMALTGGNSVGNVYLVKVILTIKMCINAS
jgi:hypothetical protein